GFKEGNNRQATRPQHEAGQRLREVLPFQAGGPQDSQGFGTTERLGSQNRSQGRLSPCSSGRVKSTLPSLSLSWKSLPVEDTAVWLPRRSALVPEDDGGGTQGATIT